MNKIVQTTAAAGLVTFFAVAQDLPAPAPLPATSAVSTDVLPAQPSEVVPASTQDDFERGALCKTFRSPQYGSRGTTAVFMSRAQAAQRRLDRISAFRSFLETAEAVDQGYDVSNVKFDGVSVSKQGHQYDVVTWEGCMTVPVTEEYKFDITGVSNRPYIVKINDETVAGIGGEPGTLKIKLVKGVRNNVYIANASASPIKIQYTLANKPTAKTYTLVPSALKHIIEDDVPDFEIK